VGRLQATLRIRPGEGSVAFRFVSLMFVGMTGAAVGANGVESLFFSRFGPEFLPYLYIVLAVVTFVLTIAVSTLLARPDPTRVLLSVLAALAVMLVGARAILTLGIRWFYPALWVVMMVAWTAQIMASWGLAGALHDTRQAKRLFPLYGSGLILGGVVGGLMTGPLASTIGAENLLLVWVAALALVVVIGRSVTGIRRIRSTAARRRVREPGPLRQMAKAVAVVRSSGLLRVMSVSLTLFAVLYFSLALVFAEAATERFPRTDELAGFLGLFMGVSNGLALAVSLLVANRLFARFGVPSMVMALTIIYLVGFTGLAIRAPFGALVTFRLVQMVWVNGIWATGWQALFNVVPSEHRTSVRSFMDGGPLQAGVLLSGVLLLLGDRLLSPRGLYAAAAVAAAVAAWAMWRARRAYGEAVADALRAGNPDVFRHEDEPFAGLRQDGDVVAALVAAVSGPDPVARRISMGVLAEATSPEAVPAYLRGLDDPDPQVRSAAVRGLVGAGDPEVSAERFAAMLGDPDGEVRAAAAAALMDLSDDRGAPVLLEMARSPEPQWRAAAVARLGRAPDGTDAVLAGLSDPEPVVRGTAARAAADADGSRLAERLIETLGDPEPGVREAAAESLARAGPGVGESLVRALARPETEDGALLALARLPDVDASALRAYATAEGATAIRYHELWRHLDPREDERLDLLAHAVRHRALEHAARALRALTAMHPRSIDLALENLDNADPQQRANALEMLEGTGDRDVVRPLLSVWETLPARDGDRPAALAELIDDEDPWIGACARYATEPPEGDPVETLSTLSLMDRMLFLRKVGLFADLSPADLKHVAEASTEHVFPPGHVIAAQGESGDDMHIVVDGGIEVVVADTSGGSHQVARRMSGEYVGEMAILDQEPRMASLIATGDTRTLSIDRRRFQRILRERPQASLAVMRVLSQRLREAHASESRRSSRAAEERL
jgi:HEAT repeat protein